MSYAFLAIDPGQDSGWAGFDNLGFLLGCGVGNLPLCNGSVVIERPQVYEARNSKGDPNGLITLAIQVGKYAERYESRGCNVRLCLPREWKGTIDKAVHHARILKDLSPLELDYVQEGKESTCKSKAHNLLDAIGIGKWAFKMGHWPKV